MLGHSNTCHPDIVENRHRYPYLEHCVGAIDGTHVTVEVSAANTRDDMISVNNLIYTDFNFNSTFAVVGWHGSAHDGLLTAPVRENGWRLPFWQVRAGGHGPRTHDGCADSVSRGALPHRNYYLNCRRGCVPGSYVVRT